MKFQLIWMIPFTLMLIACGYYDIKYRKIPNFISFTLILAGLFVHLVANGWPGFRQSCIGCAIGCSFFLLFYFFKMMGAGDVKFMAGIGAVIGSQYIITSIIFTVLCGGLLSLFYLIAHYAGRKKQRVSASAISAKAFKKSVPYGIAIAMGTIITLIINFRHL